MRSTLFNIYHCQLFKYHYLKIKINFVQHTHVMLFDVNPFPDFSIQETVVNVSVAKLQISVIIFHY